MRILAIETSCDETSLAIVEARGGIRAPRFRVIKNIVSSQIMIHRPYGGVVPMLAKREHIKNLPILWKKIVRGIPAKQIDAIAVTVGPGLEPALWTGIEFAKKMSLRFEKPLHGANHMKGHLYSAMLSNPKISFPAMVLIASGGHTILLAIKNAVALEKIGETVDDAAGEAFDKVGRLLGLPYPGGPEIERLAKNGNPYAIKFPKTMPNSYDFSFSGIKTAILYYIKKNPKANRADIAASFQKTVVDILVRKTVRAALEYGARSIVFCGGVAANSVLRQEFGNSAKEIGKAFIAPPQDFNTDNAAMIAASAYIDILINRHRSLSANGTIDILD